MISSSTKRVSKVSQTVQNALVIPQVAPGLVPLPARAQTAPAAAADGQVFTEAAAILQQVHIQPVPPLLSSLLMCQNARHHMSRGGGTVQCASSIPVVVVAQPLMHQMLEQHCSTGQPTLKELCLPFTHGMQNDSDLTAWFCCRSGAAGSACPT